MKIIDDVGMGSKPLETGKDYEFVSTVERTNGSTITLIDLLTPDRNRTRIEAYSTPWGNESLADYLKRRQAEREMEGDEVEQRAQLKRTSARMDEEAERDEVGG